MHSPFRKASNNDSEEAIAALANAYKTDEELTVFTALDAEDFPDPSEYLYQSNTDMVTPEAVKILFRYYSDVLEEETVETMWADVIDADNHLYKIDNIPFYGPPVASDDIVFALYDEQEQMLTFRNVVEPSGNSIVQVVLMNDTADKEEIRAAFKQLGCASEGLNKKYFVLEVPVSIDYAVIKAKLEELEKRGDIGYAEPVLSEQHRNT